MRRIPTLVLAVGLLTGACAADEGAQAPIVVTTSTAPSTTLPATTATPQSTTAAPSTSTSTSTTTTAPLVPLDQIELAFVPIAEGFEQPVFVTTAPGDARLFVLDQPGVIWLLDGADAAEFLDIRDDVAFRGERGLLGLAFHPGYTENGRFFVNYTNNDGDTVVAEFTSDGDRADAGSGRTLLEIDQPASNHNGGMIAFGPDGYLWIGTGDGGGADDKFGQGQRSETLLGAMLRIDVDGGDPYAIPDDNPFADGVDGAPEVWAIGLRNPWRWSFDGDRIIIADVGQNQREEVNVASAGASGLNYGWPIMEGLACFSRSSCDQGGLVLPAIQYTHDNGCSITGGYVYRGRDIPELDGHYFYGDYCQGWVHSAVIDGSGEVTESFEWFDQGTLSALTSFGVDADGELYATTVGGTVWKLQRG